MTLFEKRYWLFSEMFFEGFSDLTKFPLAHNSILQESVNMLGLYVTLKISLYNEAAKHLGIQTALVNMYAMLWPHISMYLLLAIIFALQKHFHFLLFLNTNAKSALVRRFVESLNLIVDKTLGKNVGRSHQ